MRTVREILRRAPVWVNPAHRANSAIVLMRGHDIGALPVLDGERLVGMVLYSHLLGIDPGCCVSEVMMVGVPVLTPDMSVREAADWMTRSGMGRLPVLDNGELIGVLTDGDLLPELGRSFDPMTELPWTDSLREWAIEQLKRGAEITVIFFDLNRFGQFNKIYGHIIGDEVLQSVARTLVDNTDTDIDFLSRHGGDEFCVATLRTAEDATELGARIARKISEIKIESLGDERIYCSVGQFGGKRTKEREHTHYAATMNSLINLASRDCTANKLKSYPSGQSPTATVKMREGDIPPPQEPFSARLRLSKIEVMTEDKKARVHVELQLANPAYTSPMQETLLLDGLTRYSATATVDKPKQSMAQLIAETTVHAMRDVLPEGYDISLSDVLENTTTNGQTLITVAGLFHAPDNQMPIAGSALVAEDPNRAAAAAVLAAVNRLLDKLLAKPILPGVRAPLR